MRLFSIVAAALALAACGRPGDGTPGQIPIAESDIGAFYRSYEAALNGQRRDTLPAYYHPDGATIVFNGERMELTHAGLVSLYALEWEGPQFVAFDSLHSQHVGSSHVVVTGGFRWLPPASQDTGKYLYLAILQQTAAGPRILVEHETIRPPEHQ
jgi:hypothetical protein